MLRVGIVGLGGMGHGRLPLYADAPEARVEAVADVRCDHLRSDPTLGDALGQAAGDLRWFSDFRELASSATVDVVDICLPTLLHREAAEVCLQAGLHVLCEKPMSLSLSDCDAMLAASRSSSCKLMIAHCVRFWPEYVFLSDLVRNGEYGQLLSLRLGREGPLPRGGNGWMCRTAESGGALLDLHIHDIDYAQSLLGLPSQVYSQGVCHGDHPLTHDSVMTSLDYGEGLQVSAFAQWIAAHIPFVARYDATFERACLRYDSSQSRPLTLYRADGKAPEAPEFSSSRTAYSEEVGYFLRCVLEDRPPERCSPEASRNSVGLVSAARVSRQQRVPVPTADWLIAETGSCRGQHTR